MAEYIEREAALSEIEDMISNIAFSSPYQSDIATLISGMERVRDCVENAGAADVAPVVYCCDCKHLSVYNTKDVYAWCRKIGFTFLPFETDTRTHFCGFGERMDGDG